jgi:hypothetical protein
LVPQLSAFGFRCGRTIWQVQSFAFEADRCRDSAADCPSGGLAMKLQPLLLVPAMANAAMLTINRDGRDKVLTP